MSGRTTTAITTETLGAWLLKANPGTYPIADWIRDRPEVPVTAWSVQRNYRSELMESGQQVFLWVSGNGRDIESGVWGSGHVTGPCEDGVADEEWLDDGAAARATYFANVEIDFLAAPVHRVDIKADPRLADLEVLRVPSGSNPSFLTREQADAMREHALVADRGTCPRCRSGEILHVVLGMLPPDALRDSPPWVREGGCVVSGLPTNRHCPACGLGWLSVAGRTAKVRSFHELREVLGTPTTEDLESWLWDLYDVDVEVEDPPDDHDQDGVLTLRIGTRGVSLEFPFPLTELETTVEELFDDVMEEWADDD